MFYIRIVLIWLSILAFLLLLIKSISMAVKNECYWPYIIGASLALLSVVYIVLTVSLSY